jgi:glutathione S-transferase
VGIARQHRHRSLSDTQLHFQLPVSQGRRWQARPRCDQRGRPGHAGVTRRWPRSGHLVGDSFTLADVYVMPVLEITQRAPEGKEMV